MPFDCKKEYKEFYMPEAMPSIGLRYGIAFTIKMMHEFAEANGFTPDIGDARMNHEIYLSDPGKCVSERLKTVVRHPIRRR